jgi:1-phosphatidylinositol-3-phosphate 5-kinase
LEDLRSQEAEYLRLLVDKISTMRPKPDIVVVEKSVSRLAQEYFLEKGITLVLNVKPHLIQLLTRLTKAQSLKSLTGTLTATTYARARVCVCACVCE